MGVGAGTMGMRFFPGPLLSNFTSACCASSLSLFLVSCQLPPLSIQSDFVRASSLRLAQVTALDKRDEIIQSKPLYDAIIASGIADTEIVDGSVVVARIYCCGGLTKNLSPEKMYARLLYVPKGLSVAPGDIVEFRAGRFPERGDGGLLNRVTRVVQRNGPDNAACWWEPKDDRLRLRVLYCSWMLGEGWVKQEGDYPGWFKPPTPGSSGR